MPSNIFLRGNGEFRKISFDIGKIVFLRESAGNRRLAYAPDFF